MPRAVRKWQRSPSDEDAAFSSYFHTLSHDLRTPLNHINGFAELLTLDEGLAHHQKEYASAIVSACGALNNAVLMHLELIEKSLAAAEEAFQAGAAPPAEAGE